MNKDEQDYLNTNYEVLESIILARNDSYIMNSLMKCGVSWPVIFSLIWGDTLINNKEFPVKIRELVLDITQEEKKKNSSSDSLERRIHSIAIELLQLLYKREVNDMCEKVMKNANLRI